MKGFEGKCFKCRTLVSSVCTLYFLSIDRLHLRFVSTMTLVMPCKQVVSPVINLEIEKVSKRDL